MFFSLLRCISLPQVNYNSKICIRLFVVFVVLLQGSLILDAQIFLQLERFNSHKTIKFIEGDVLEFRIHDYPKTWRHGTLDRIMLDEETIILDGEFFQLEDIKDLRITKHGAQLLGLRMYQFAAVWSTFAIVADVANAPVAFGEEESFKIGIDTVAIAGGSALLGFVFQKILGRKKYKLGKNSRLRFVDLRLSVD